MERTFDRIPRFDERSRNYPIRSVIRGERRWVRVHWTSGPVTDQGSEGACVGHGWTAEATCTPVAVDLAELADPYHGTPDAYATDVYREAQKLDPWPGENYSGTSVLAGAKVMQQVGVLREYRWAFGLQDVIGALLTTGPVVLGINWYSGMYTAPGGRLSVSGYKVGGHCLLATGYQPEHGIILQNSWGPDWGINGLAYISEADLARLLSEDGEACVPYRRSYGR